jgi:hypothetical protein
LGAVEAISVGAVEATIHQMCTYIRQKKNCNIAIYSYTREWNKIIGPIYKIAHVEKILLE